MKTLMLSLIKFYQKFLSPRNFGMNTCRFVPSCSEYMYQSIQKFGCFRGVGMGVLRLFRCNPFSEGGFDPVKE
jgi:uncharacterized protein